MIMDPSTGLQIDNKQFFANLTKDYPKVSEDWLELLCTENLPRIMVDQVQQELQKNKC